MNKFKKTLISLMTISNIFCSFASGCEQKNSSGHKLSNLEKSRLVITCLQAATNAVGSVCSGGMTVSVVRGGYDAKVASIPGVDSVAKGTLAVVTPCAAISRIRRQSKKFRTSDRIVSYLLSPLSTVYSVLIGGFAAQLSIRPAAMTSAAAAVSNLVGIGMTIAHDVADKKTARDKT